MKIHKGYKSEKENIPNGLEDLFHAMKEGKTISEIELSDDYKKIKGENIIIDCEPTDYWVGMQANGSTDEKYDYVDCKSKSKIKSFYMSWVKRFKL